MKIHKTYKYYVNRVNENLSNANRKFYTEVFNPSRIQVLNSVALK